MATVISTTSTREEREHLALPFGTRMVPVWNAIVNCVAPRMGPCTLNAAASFRSHATAAAVKALFN